MKLNLHPSIIYRTPQFSLTDDIKSNWEELKKSIAVSSNEFYQNIKDVTSDELDAQPEKIQYTLWKYFNRAKYRSTPYGTFSGFGIINTDKADNTNVMFIENRQHVQEFIDWPEKDKLEYAVAEQLTENCFLFANSSFYTVQPIIRYIALENKAFELVDVDHNQFALNILNACLKPIKVADLSRVLNISNTELNNFHTFLGDLIELQLLLTHHSPNIIGEDFFQRIGFQANADTPKYHLTERKYLSGNIDTNLFKELPVLLTKLKNLLPANSRNSLNNFITKFQKRFEQREIPLMIAIDPETGVGYDDLEQSEQADPFVAQFASRNRKREESSDIPFKNYISTQSKKEQSIPNTIFLDELIQKEAKQNNLLPNSFSAMLSVADDLIILDMLGGITANSLAGRFTMANTEIQNHTREIAAIEQEANPEVLFFDIAYLVESRIDNVNRRKSIYDYQLSILNYDTSADPITLNDLYLSVIGEQLILRSKRLNKRLIPRMASAYNYTRSDLSVFRLLCDLQDQGIQSSLNFNIQSMLPDQVQYPRIQYKNIILSLAKWEVQLKELQKDNHKLSIPLCRQYLKELGIKRYFKTGLSDQTLCFDLEQDNDLHAFLQMLQKQKSLLAEEVLLPVNSCIQDLEGKPHTGQFVLSFTHNQEIYKGLPSDQETVNKTPSFFPPGSEWLYFEIYCHPQRADQILTDKISTYLDRHSALIRRHFFIRYSENGMHIRFRIELNNHISDGQLLISALADLFSDELSTGLISDLQLKTYKREMERYGADMIITVEEHFCTDSNYVLSLLPIAPTAFEKYKLCVQIALAIQDAELFESIAFRQIVENNATAFNHEHHIEIADFKKLNTQYQEYRKATELELNTLQKERLQTFIHSFISTLKQCAETKRSNLFNSLMHMHVNRLFNQDQRTHEMVMYYFLSKDLLRLKHLSLPLGEMAVGQSG